ncbi:hypothetical protein FVE85_4063 [Porphyridium purpureum]|uniref:Uncharacterized protein n=1 Tax=Porphyridium purpureum TaxID=35688 RepID=A0A5J4YS12_PORPP|nr:hypothetical protein FVE85_4063 [Porphyridium purpureum]|eukprot:POR2350..scf229_5
MDQYYKKRKVAAPSGQAAGAALSSERRKEKGHAPQDQHSADQSQKSKDSSRALQDPQRWPARPTLGSYHAPPPRRLIPPRPASAVSVGSKAGKRKRFRRRGPGILGAETDLHRRLSGLLTSDGMARIALVPITSPGSSTESNSSATKKERVAEQQRQERQLNAERRAQRLEPVLGSPQSARTVAEAMGDLSPSKNVRFQRQLGLAPTPHSPVSTKTSAEETKRHAERADALRRYLSDPKVMQLLRAPPRLGAMHRADNPSSSAVNRSHMSDSYTDGATSLPAVLRRSVPPQVSPRRAMRRYVKQHKRHLPESSGGVGSHAGHQNAAMEYVIEDRADRHTQEVVAQSYGGFELLLGAVNAVQSAGVSAAHTVLQAEATAPVSAAIATTPVVPPATPSAPDDRTISVRPPAFRRLEFTREAEDWPGDALPERRRGAARSRQRTTRSADASANVSAIPARRNRPPAPASAASRPPRGGAAADADPTQLSDSTLSD